MADREPKTLTVTLTRQTYIDAELHKVGESLDLPPPLAAALVTSNKAVLGKQSVTERATREPDRRARKE